MSRLHYFVSSFLSKHGHKLIWYTKKKAKLFKLNPNWSKSINFENPNKKNLKLWDIMEILLSIRLDSLRREPWSTMIIPSLSPTPCGICLNPPFPVPKHNILLKFLYLQQSPCGFGNLRRSQLEFVVFPVLLTEELHLH